METVDIHGRAHPTYQGVLDEAHKKGLKSIETEILQFPAEANNWLCIVKATVTIGGIVCQGIGDASPKNVGNLISPHFVRMAETRAKGRALRDALNIGKALKEEMLGKELDQIAQSQ